MFDDVLFNRRPPLSIPGGVKDALQATHGEVIGVENKDAEEAHRLFERTEGIDIMPAAAVAVAALIGAVRSGSLRKSDVCAPEHNRRGRKGAT